MILDQAGKASSAPTSTRHVLTLVTLPQVFAECDPGAFVAALDAGGWMAVDVRLRGGRGPTNEGRMSSGDWTRWQDALKPHFGTTRPTYADAMFALTDEADLERWGHGWLEAPSLAAVEREAAACAKVSEGRKLRRWGCNAEIGTFGRDRKFRPEGLALSRAFVKAFGRVNMATVLDWMGFASLRWMYGAAVPEFDAEFCDLWGLCAQMVYQTTWGGKHGAQETAERGRRVWQVQTEVDCWTPLVGVGRWHDDDGDGVVDPGEVVGDPETLRKLIETFLPSIVRHYVGYGAATQITVGHERYPALASLVPQLSEAA